MHICLQQPITNNEDKLYIDTKSSLPTLTFILKNYKSEKYEFMSKNRNHKINLIPLTLLVLILLLIC